MNNGSDFEWIKTLSEEEIFWYHCGRCGSLYQSEIDFSEDRLCPHCGMNPAPDIIDSAVPLRSAAAEVERFTLAQPVVARGRRPRKTHVIFKVLLAWLILIGLIVIFARWFGDEGVGVDGDPAVVAPAAGEAGKPQVDQELLDLALPACRYVLAQFLSTEQVDARLPLVISRDSVESRMNHYYQTNSLLITNPQALKLKTSTIAHLPEGATVLTQWETQEGATFDAAFRLDRGQWLLDWDHFVRYSDQSWPLFVAGSGPDEAEFRLLARRRMTSEEDPSNSIGVVLYAPMRRHLEQLGFSAQIQALSLKERDGQLLQAAFDHASRGEPFFGATFSDVNPQGMIRVRVLVKRINGEGQFKLRISQVKACHWYSSSAWGVTPVDESESEKVPDGDAP